MHTSLRSWLFVLAPVAIACGSTSSEVSFGEVDSGVAGTAGAGGSAGSAASGGSGGGAASGGSAGVVATGGAGGGAATGGAAGADSGVSGAGGADAGAAGAAGGGGTAGDPGSGGTGGVAGVGGTSGASGAGGTAGTGGTSGTGGTGGTAGTSGTGGTAGTGGTGGGTPVCGNRIIEAGEECDDGGQAKGDGCDDQCQVVCQDIDGDAKENPSNHHCYWERSGTFDDDDWGGAQGDCARRLGHLVTLDSLAEATFARSVLNREMWIGATDGRAAGTPGVGTYRWWNGSPLTYSNWAPGEPNANQVACGFIGTDRCYEHCATLRPDLTWNDRYCNAEIDYVCEWDAPGTL